MTSDSADLEHLGPDGSARMVDVGAKAVTRRTASAEAYVTVGPEIAERLRTKGVIAKGNVLQVARLAGIAAAKQTAALIPLCHPIALEVVEVEAAVEGDRVRIRTRAAAEAKTGVEMEALTAAAVAALTVYDMVKSAGKGIEIGPVRLLEKEGGTSGRWSREEHGDGAR
ncbi:MAG: cyclic pyranopterin monophosphate synthase MoaC [Phycisphaerae bacterium]|nr:cyclic pyranopterin monophosphate synthase MoaC [Phycisphaerae bacterium]